MTRMDCFVTRSIQCFTDCITSSVFFFGCLTQPKVVNFRAMELLRFLDHLLKKSIFSWAVQYVVMLFTFLFHQFLFSSIANHDLPQLGMKFDDAESKSSILHIFSLNYVKKHGSVAVHAVVTFYIYFTKHIGSILANDENYFRDIEIFFFLFGEFCTSANATVDKRFTPEVCLIYF